MKKLMKKGWWLVIGFLCSLFLVASAFAAGDSYPAKDNITWIVASAPGGGFDTLARGLAPYLGKHLPRPVNVIVKNIPGAGGLTGASTLFQAKPDGYTIGYVYFPGIGLLAKTAKIGFDYRKFTSIAQISIDEQAIFVSAKSDIKTLADLQKKNPLRVLTQPKGVSMYSFWQVAIDVMKFKPKIITGYKGGNEVATGLMRDDGDAGILNLGQFIKYAKSGDLRIITTLANKRNPLTPDVPCAGELGYGESNIISSWKIIYGPPGLPANISKTLETAFEKTLNDPKVKVWAGKAEQSLDFVPGKKSWENMQQVIATYSKYE